MASSSEHLPNEAWRGSRQWGTQEGAAKKEGNWPAPPTKLDTPWEGSLENIWSTDGGAVTEPPEEGTVVI